MLESTEINFIIKYLKLTTFLELKFRYFFNEKSKLQNIIKNKMDKKTSKLNLLVLILERPNLKLLNV